MIPEKATVITCLKQVQIVDFPKDVDSFLKLANDAVRFKDYDMLERVQFFNAGFQMWCNESGLLINGPLNPIATILCGFEIRCGVVLTGLDSEDGDVLPLSDTGLILSEKLEKMFLNGDFKDQDSWIDVVRLHMLENKVKAYK